MIASTAYATRTKVVANVNLAIPDCSVTRVRYILPNLSIHCNIHAGGDEIRGRSRADSSSFVKISPSFDSSYDTDWYLEIIVAQILFPGLSMASSTFLKMIVFTHLFFPAACPEGTYGANCEERCACQNEGICDPVTGACECPPGVIGDRCENGM